MMTNLPKEATDRFKFLLILFGQDEVCKDFE